MNLVVSDLPLDTKSVISSDRIHYVHLYSQDQKLYLAVSDNHGNSLGKDYSAMIHTTILLEETFTSFDVSESDGVFYISVLLLEQNKDFEYELKLYRYSPNSPPERQPELTRTPKLVIYENKQNDATRIPPIQVDRYSLDHGLSELI